MESKNWWFVIGVVFVSLIGVVTHASIASQRVERWIVEVSDRFDEFNGQNGKGDRSLLPIRGIVIPYSASPFVSPSDGVYNYQSRHNDGFFVVVKKSYHIALGQHPQTFGWYMPLPFLLISLLHFGVAWGLPQGYRYVWTRRVILLSDRSLGKRALLAALYAYVIAVFFQSSRMFWGSEAWDGAYFVSYQYGWPAFYLFFGLCIAIYLYCVIGTAGLQVRRNPTSKKQTCIKCKYNLEGLVDKCPECDLEIGVFVPSKLRINHWCLAGMFAATFFTPVLVASVYSILG